MNTIRLPGLIDMHVHLRDPGQTQKEDFTTGTSAALAGGFTFVGDMPNNALPITSIERLQQKIKIAEKKIVSDIGFYYGSLGNNLDSFQEAAQLTLGLKLYLNKTTGDYLLSPGHLQKIYKAWPRNSLVLLHVEEDMISLALDSLKKLDRPVHICHMPSRAILQKIIAAKKAGLPITCGVCPHHLFLTSDDLSQLGPYGDMLPPLKNQRDQDYLWQHLDDIDIFESDHAPHTRQEKIDGAHGVPGLETTLPLLLTAETQGRITRQQIIDKCHDVPRKLFCLPEQKNSYCEVEIGDYAINEKKLQTKCGWSPFTGEIVTAKVIRTCLRGEVVFEDGKILSRPGAAQIFKPSKL